MMEFPFLDPINNFINSNKLVNSYRIFSGINTSYSFYGSNVSTNKYFLVELYDANNKLLREINCADHFYSKTGYARFQTLAPKLTNFIAITEMLEKEGKIDAAVVKEREEHVHDVLKYIGASMMKNDEKVKTYTVKLMMIVPIHVWEARNLEQNNVFVTKEYSYDI